jgi:hypothetical protein
MKKGEIIKNGNVNLENITSKGIIPSEETWENKNLFRKLNRAISDPCSFAMEFYLWSKDNVHPIPTGNGYRLKPEDFKVKHDLRSVVKYFEEKVYEI